MSEKNKEDRNGTAVSASTNLPPDVKKAGVLRKLKTMKKKFFVLRNESDSGPARLEYYDNEKKFRSGAASKRSIIIKKCFNINRKVDAKQKLAIALYTKDDCFSVVVDNEQLLEEWLKALLELQLDANSINSGGALKPKFEHVWQVTIGEKSLACSRSLRGLHHLCLTKTSLTLVKMDQSDKAETVEFPLMSIRRCGHSNNYFLIELGRSSITGAGELWLETEDVVIAQNMHEVTLNAMKSCRELEDMGSYRPRSASNTETSRPIATRRPVAVVSAQPNPYPSVRDRCDSMPSRPRTISEGQEINNRSYYASPNHPVESLRSHSSFTHTISYSPPGISNPLSPCSTVCSTDSAGSSLSIDEYDGGTGSNDFTHGRYAHNMPTDNTLMIEPPIKEEALDDYMPMSMKGPKETSGYMHMTVGNSYSSSAPSGPSLYLNLSPSERESIKTTVIPTVTTTASSSQNYEYVEMTSPSSPPGDYLPMSPLAAKVQNSSASDTNLTKDPKSNISVSNSSTKPAIEGYLYMAPVSAATATGSPLSSSSSHTEGYLDMAPLSSSLPKTTGVLSGNPDRFSFQTNNCASDTSVNSSADTSKSEVYHLDKVKSLLTDTDDMSDDYIRPVRAYSMGSRPQPKKTHLSIHNEGSRIRAYSVGSQAGSHRNKVINPVDHEFGSLKRGDMRAGPKSSSAPLLHSRPPRLRPSASRGEVSEDLMEIDYTKCRHLTPNSVNIRDSEFTIEPVGRSRSGSYSSSASSFSSGNKSTERYTRPVLERDKTAHGASSYSSLSGTTESISINGYMPMSPPSWATAMLSASAPNNSIKPVEHVHPAGDYVSLSPACRYQPATNIVLPSISLSSSTTPYSKMTSDVTSFSSLVSSHSPGNQYSQQHGNNGFSQKNDLTQHRNFGASMPVDITDDYLPMDFSKTENNNLSTKTAPVVNNTKAQSGGDNSDHNLKSSSNDIAPHVNNSSSPTTDNGMGTTSPEEDVPVNYTSIDLFPDVTMIMPVHRTTAAVAASSDTKEVPLTYAEIDFSTVKTHHQDSSKLSQL